MRLRSAVAAWLLITLSGSFAFAFPWPSSRYGCVEDATEPPKTDSSALASSRHLCNGGLAQVRLLLDSPDESKRRLGYLRIRARHNDDGWRLLGNVLSQSRRERTPTEDLALARILAPNVRNPLVRPSVARLAVAASARLDPTEPLRALAMQTCLISLAWSNSEASLGDLGHALKSAGALSDAAVEALLVHLPEPFARLSSPTVPRSPAWARLLGRTHRGEAIAPLRQELLEGNSDMQLAAAEALAELQDRAIAPLFQRWMNDSRTPAAFAQLAKRLTTGAKARATAAPDSALELTAALDAVAILHWLRAPNDAVARWYRSTETGERHRLASATLLSAFGHRDAPSIATPWLQARLDEHDDTSEFAAAALLAKLEPSRVETLLRQHQEAVERAVSWALPYLDADSPLLASVGTMLEHQVASDTSSLLCSGLVHEPLRRAMTNAWLLAMAHGEGPCAPLAAEVLATRDGMELRDALRRLLDATHPLMRSAVARGLAESLAPSATSLLLARYAVEPEVRVRRALVRSLGRRPVGLAREVLLEAAHFDPDPLVRIFADRGVRRLPLEVQPGDPLGFGLAVLAASPELGQQPFDARVLALPSASASDPLADRVAIVSGPDGACLPVASDPHGLILVPVTGGTLELESYSRPHVAAIRPGSLPDSFAP